jgi:arginyl-tRNA synthetase
MYDNDVKQKIAEAVIRAVREFFAEKLPSVVIPGKIDPSLQYTKDKQHGDLTSNIAMRLAGAVKMPPAALSEGLRAQVESIVKAEGGSSYIGKVEAKSGFLNIWFSDRYYTELLTAIKKDGAEYGRCYHGKGTKVNIEYVSANPTGPLTIAHGRQAAIGDALSRLLKHCGYDVTNEYYLNDFGRQIRILGKSTEIRYRNLCGKDDKLPEDSYEGEYIIDIAQEIKNKKGESLLAEGPDTDKFFREYAVENILGTIKKDLDDFRVKFDVWTSQAGIEDRKEVEKILSLLEARGFIYESEGAKWFKSTSFGDDKDRVVIKSDGSYTYLAPDMAYHSDKYSRGFDKLIDLLGPDHHGYIPRMKAAVQALGKKADALDILIVQLVTLMRNGEVVRMSTRKAEFVSLREIIDEIGTDVARFFFLMRRLDSHLDFDIEVAKKESADNPVFYIQYAHARIRSIERFSAKKFLPLFFTKLNAALLTDKAERDLICKLGEFPLAVRTSADTLEPSTLITYLNELARVFHSFYTDCRVVSDDISRTKARLYLVECVRRVLANGLGILNISLPDKM